MGIFKREFNDEEFKGTVYVLTCDITDKKLANILILKDNTELEKPLEMRVMATSPFIEGANSGWHTISGLLRYGPIGEEESNTPTSIQDVIYENKQGTEHTTLIIKER